MIKYLGSTISDKKLSYSRETASQLRITYLGWLTDHALNNEDVVQLDKAYM